MRKRTEILLSVLLWVLFAGFIRLNAQEISNFDATMYCQAHPDSSKATKEWDLVCSGGKVVVNQNTLPDAPMHSPVEKRTKAAIIFNLSASVFDIETTRSFLAPRSHCYEINPIVGRHPSGALLYATGLGANGVMDYLVYKLAQHGHKKMYLLPLIVGSLQTGSAVRNLNLHCY